MKRPWVADLLLGVAWFVVMYAIDLATSYWAVRDAMGKVDHDPGIVDVVHRQVVAYLLQMLDAYLFMGVLAGVFLLLVRRTHGGAAWAGIRLGSIGLVSLWMTLKGAILWPRLYYGPGIRMWANIAHPLPIDILFGAAFSVWLLRAMRKNRAHPAFALGLLFWCVGISLLDLQPPADRAERNEGPNVIVFGVDGLRPDHMGFFGYERDTTPSIDRFLGEAAVYDSAITPLARTWPAWSTILTGVEPLYHGKRDSLPAPGQERPDVPMITDALGQAGIHTRFLTDDSRFSYMLPAHNFDVISQPPIGIQAFAVSRKQLLFRAFHTFLDGPLGWRMVDVYRYNQAMGATYTPEAFAEHIAQNIAEASREGRFFMAVHTCLLHAPGDRPWPYHRMFDMEQGTGINRFAYRSTGSKAIDGDEFDDDELVELERRDQQQNLNIYDAGLVMVDETWARVERALREGGLLDNTVVILLSDHGEEFYEGDERYKFRGPSHGFHPWGTGQNRVVLAAKGPGFDRTRQSELRGLVDVAPTVARVFGVDLPSAHGVPLQDVPPQERVLFGETGASEAAYWARGHVRPKIKRAHHRYTVDPDTLQVYQRPQYDRDLALAKDRWAVSGEWWLVSETLESGPRYSLYRWREDPLMRRDLQEIEPEVFERLRQALEERPVILGEPSLADLADDEAGP